ncbi:MAG: hypothetical protein E7649_01760 [Ruminococcaceae bacterium]|nr:hypothetical protein [Oscillospiraceae bacterium]
MILAAFVGCDKAEDTENFDDLYEDDFDDLEYFPDVEKNNYNDDLNFYVVTQGEQDFYVLEESNGSPMDEAVYARQERIRRYLGVSMILYSPTGYDWQTYAQAVSNAITNKDGTIDAMIPMNYAQVTKLVSEHYLEDWLEIDGVDLYAEYWNLKAMEELELKGRCFFALGDCIILNTYIVGFNKDMYAKYKDNEVFGGKTFYDLVYDYEWTWEKMIEISSLVYLDRTGDGKTLDDTYGFSSNGWEFSTSIIQACGMKLLEMDEAGNWKMAINNSTNYPKMQKLVEILSEWYKSENAYVAFKSASWESEPVVSMTSGRTLMSFGSTANLESWLDYDIDFGVLPYPMYDTNQKAYYSLQWSGLLALPTYMTDPQMSAETMEMFCFYSDPVRVTFYEKLLGKQVSDAPEDADMLDIIWDSLCLDIGQTFCQVDYALPIPYTLSLTTDPDPSTGSETNLASLFAKKEALVNNGMIEFLKSIK